MSARNAPGDRHRVPTVGLRLSAGLRDWLRGHAEATGRPLNTILVELVSGYAAEHGYVPGGSDKEIAVSE